MTTKEFLLDQFTSCYDVNGWFVALKNTVHNLTAEQAAWKPDGGDNSIWGILAHLNFYNERYLKKFKNEPVEKVSMENSETFAAAENALEDDWKSEIERFEALMSGWRKALEAADEDKFEQVVSAKNQSTWAEIVGLINTHNSHHAGQIVLLRKLQGSWDVGSGVS